MNKAILPVKLLVYLFPALLFATCTSSAVQYHTVEIAQMKFIPAQLIVHKGDQVTFINHDMVLHNVTNSTGQAIIDSLQAGVSRTITASETVSYYCSLHPVMKGRIVVK